ncbi:MAG: TlpA family protein disulfide reductase [Flavobacterium sp.]|nr:TlpA family protein disulfide reductase [Flavobacterium sp.]
MKKAIIFCLFFSLVVQAQIKVGDALPTFILANASDNKVSSTLFQNKFILIDFWASWCAPCRLANKKLVQLYAVIDKSKIDFISISLDTNKLKWIKAIEKDKLKFTQLIDPKGFDANSAMAFGVNELPSKFLFNNKGILVAINPTNEQIINFLK